MKSQQVMRASKSNGLECTGMIGICTKGAYKEAQPSGINHAQKINDEHAHKSLYGKKEAVIDKQTVSLDLKALEYLMKKAKLSRDELRVKTGLASVTFNKAFEGGNIYMMTAEKYANALNIGVWMVVK